MIDTEVFSRVISGFADKIGRALGADTVRMYYDVLSAELATEEFLVGARIVFRNHVYNTWPAPQQFIDAARPARAPKLAAAEAFEDVLAIACDAYVPFPKRLVGVAALGTVAARAFRAAGGRRDFENALEQDVPWLRKRFVEAYEAATAEEATLNTACLALEALDAATGALVASTANALALPNRKRLPAPTDSSPSGEEQS